MRATLFIAVAVLCCVGCDDQSTPTLRAPGAQESSPASQPAAVAQATAEATGPVTSIDSPTKPLPLAVIPFVAEAPESWAVGSNDLGRIVLHGPVSSGDVNILLSTRSALTAEAFNNLLQEVKVDSTQPSGQPAGSAGESTRVLSRDNMTIIETTKRLAAAGASPDESLVIYNAKYLVPGPSLEYLVYELNVEDLSQTMYDKDGELIRKVMLGLKHDPAAMGTMP